MCTLSNSRRRYNTSIANCAFSKGIWNECGHRFGAAFNLREEDNIWRRSCIDNSTSKIKVILVASICLNIWPERNNRIFNKTTHTIHSCFGGIYFDVISWIGLLLEEGTRAQIDNFQGATKYVSSSAYRSIRNGR